MFTAFSKSKNDEVSVENEYDLSEVFLCPNPKCSAKFKIKSAHGKKAKHFAKTKDSIHIDKCLYDFGNNSFCNDDNLVKYQLDEIFNQTKKIKKNNTSSNTKKNENNESSTRYIRTAKQLLLFCIANNLEHEYLNGNTVNDIMVDCRNVNKSKKYEGVSGILMLLGETYKYNEKEHYFIFSINSRSNPKIHLNCKVYMERPVFYETKKYLFDTYGNIKGHSIAVLGNWEIDSKYNISCTLKNKKQLILKF